MQAPTRLTSRVTYSVPTPDFERWARERLQEMREKFIATQKPKTKQHNKAA